MLILYDIGHIKLDGLTNYKELKLDREINIEDTLSFLYPISDPKHDLIQEECYIRTQDNEYIVKEVNYKDDDWTEYICKINIEGIKGKDINHFETIAQSCTNSVNLALVGTDWTIGTCDVTKLRTVRKNNCSAYIVLHEIQSAYACEMTFDAIAKKVYIYQSLGTDKGSYFAEQLNLKKLDVQRNSYDYITRLIPLGKDGLGIASINGGLNYVQNNQYSNKVITAYWEDNRYTDAPSLLEDATARLDYLSKPYKAYKADVIDLANINTQYNILDYSLGDTITLLAKSKNTKEKQRIIKLAQYPDEPERNTCEIANKLLNLANMQVRFVDTADTVDTVTTVDGLLDGTKVDGVDWTKVQNVSIITADIQDASITTAKIGNLQVTTALIADASITNAKIDRASINKLQVVTADIVDANITTAKIGSLAVSTAQIQDAAITTAKIGNAQIFSAKIADAQITTAKIALGAITTALIDVAAIGTTQIADGSITDAKIVGLTANKITAGTLDAGTITVINLNAANITVGTINGTQIAAGAIDVTKLGTILVNDINSKITQTQVDTSIGAIQIGGRNLVLNSVIAETSNVYGFGIRNLSINLISGQTYTISVNGRVNSQAIADGKSLMCYLFGAGSVPYTFITSLTDTTVSTTFVCNATGAYTVYCFMYNTGGSRLGTVTVNWVKVELGNKATDWSPAPEDVDAAITTVQVTANGKNKVTYSLTVPGVTVNVIGDIWFQKNASNVIIGQWEGLGGTSWSAKTIDNVVIANLDAAKITTGFLSAARIDALAITSDKLSANSVIAGKIAANAVTAGTIVAGVVNATAIATDAITAIKIAANTITGDKLVIDAITAREIAAHVITANEIQANTITAAEIKANTITAGQIAAGTITTDQLASNIGTGLDISSNTSITSKVTQAQVDTSIDAIQIGGRNLLLNSKDFTSSVWLSNMFNNWVPCLRYSDYGTAPDNTATADMLTGNSANSGVNNVAQKFYCKVSTKYIFSIWVKNVDNGSTIALSLTTGLNGAIVNYLLNTTICVLSSSVWTKYTVTCTTPASGINQLEATIYGIQNTKSILVWGAKLEEGNKATDWTPAPEDSPTNANIVSTINQTAESITITASKIGLLGAVNIPDLDAAKITSGTINASLIAVTNLNASNITTGYLNAARINGGTISGVTIDVGTDITVGDNVYIGNTSTGDSKFIKFFESVGINTYSEAIISAAKPNYPTDNYTQLYFGARTIIFDSYGVPKWRNTNHVDENLALESQLNSYSLTSHTHTGVYAPASHTHDDRYFTETEVNAKFLWPRIYNGFVELWVGTTLVGKFTPE